MRLLFWIVAIPTAVVVVVFAINNAAMTEVDLWPLETIALPVFAIGLAGLFIGFLWGGIVAWLSAGRTRQRVRDLVRRIESDQREIAVLRRQVQKFETAQKQAMIPLPPADAA